MSYLLAPCSLRTTCLPPPLTRTAACYISIELADPSNWDYINLREVELFDTNGAKVDPSNIVMTLSSTYTDGFQGGATGLASFCNDGNIGDIPGAPVDYCHTADYLGDTRPSWRVSYSCDTVLSKVMVHNRYDCCMERITKFKLKSVRSGSNVVGSYNFADLGARKTYVFALGAYAGTCLMSAVCFILPHRDAHAPHACKPCTTHTPAKKLTK